VVCFSLKALKFKGRLSMMIKKVGLLGVFTLVTSLATSSHAAGTSDNDGNYCVASVRSVEAGQLNKGAPALYVFLKDITGNNTPVNQNGWFSTGGPSVVISPTETPDAETRKSMLAILLSAQSMGTKVEIRYWGVSHNYAIMSVRLAME
jgi:hypothetical protein